jgi:gliding motility-associated-like protein
MACYNSAGTYTITANMTDPIGCRNSVSFTVQPYPKPTADFNYAPIKPIEKIDDVNFTDASFGAPISTWNWYFMNTAAATSGLQNPVYNYDAAGNYIVALVVKSDHGCVDTILKSILVGEDFGIYMPNSFTPNNDGLNDVFYGKGFGIKKFEMQIFDRWGEKVFTSTDLNEAWDGSYQAKGGVKTVMEGVYTWRIKLTNTFGKSKELTGHVTLIK